MAGLNKQLIIGRIAADAELVEVGEKNTPKASFRVIANTGYGEYEHTEGFNCVLWGKRAKSLAPHLTKGRLVYIEGETRTRSWEDGNGKRHYRTEVVVSQITFLGGKGSNGQSEESAEEDDPYSDIPF